MLRSANLHHCAKFRTSRSSRSGDMAVYWFFKMAAVPHLRFLKVRNFNWLYPSERQCASTSQISCRSVEPLPRCNFFSIFKMAAIRHIGFLNFEILTTMPFGSLKCIMMPNFVQIGQGIANIWPFSIFQDGGRPPSSIVKTYKFLLPCTPRRAEMCRLAKFCADRSNLCRDMAVFRFSRWRSSTILDFLNFAILTTHALRKSKMHHGAKFCANR